MRLMYRRPLALCAVAALALAAPAVAAAHGSGHGHDDHHGKGLRAIKRVVVIYEENHSFDNLYGGWEGVNGLRRADPAHTTQVTQAGTPYTCLLQNDVNLTSPPLSATCDDATTATPFDSHFTNDPFTIDQFIPATAQTCPAPGVFAANGVPDPTGLPGGCTRDLVHRYYQEQYQLNGGKQNRYVTGSDAVGLTQGVYDTRALPIYKYLHSKGHPDYAIADRFFQAAFGGSFLNHQWLIAAATPKWPAATVDNTGGADDLHSVVDANGMPNNYPLYTSPRRYDGQGPAADRLVRARPGPGPDAAGRDLRRLSRSTRSSRRTSPTRPARPCRGGCRRRRRRRSATASARKGVDWAWYSGGWSNADGDVGAPGWTNGTTPGTCADPNTAAGAVYPNCPDKLFQFHHQPLNYFASFAPGTAARAAHLRDEDEFVAAGAGSKKHCDLKPVSFIKPIGAENEHPGYASESSGSDHLVELLSAIQEQPLREGHAGDRDLRRVRRAVGSRVAARPGRDARRARRHGVRARASRRWYWRRACATTSSSTTPSTTRRRSWRPSSIASGCPR